MKCPTCGKNSNDSCYRPSDDMVKILKELGWIPPNDPNTKCVFEVDCTAKKSGHCSMSHCPKFLER